MKSEKIYQALHAHGIMRARDLVALGVSREYISQLCQREMIERTGRGLYRLPDGNISAYHTFVEASQRVPQGIICLLSALRFHQITTQAPFEVWMAIEVKAWRPQVADLPLRIVHFSGAAFTEGTEEHLVEGVTVKVYAVAKTVADCFKYRNKIGFDVALEALRDCRRQKRCTNNQLWNYANICRMSNVMRPYLEATL